MYVSYVYMSLVYIISLQLFISSQAYFATIITKKLRLITMWQ